MLLHRCGATYFRGTNRPSALSLLVDSLALIDGTRRRSELDLRRLTKSSKLAMEDEREVRRLGKVLRVVFLGQSVGSASLTSTVFPRHGMNLLVARSRTASGESRKVTNP